MLDSWVLSQICKQKENILVLVGLWVARPGSIKGGE